MAVVVVAVAAAVAHTIDLVAAGNSEKFDFRKNAGIFLLVIVAIKKAIWLAIVHQIVAKASAITAINLVRRSRVCDDDRLFFLSVGHISRDCSEPRSNSFGGGGGGGGFRGGRGKDSVELKTSSNFRI